MPDSYTSIFGVGAPQFEVASTVIELDYVRVVKDEPDLDDIVHPSVKTGHKEWTRRGKHWVFEVIVNLTKYGSNAYDKYQELKSYKYSLVDKLWKRRDGTQVQNDDDEDVKFFIEEIKEFYFNHYLYPDRLKMRFVSQNPIDLPIGAGSITPSWSTEVTTYFNQLDPLPDLDVLIKIAEFIDGLVADGIYVKIDEMWYYALNTEANALKGMKNFSACTKVGGLTFTPYRGFTAVEVLGNYINTNINPSTGGVKYLLNDASLGVYSRTDSSTSDIDMGERDSSNHIRLAIRSSNAVNVRINSSSGVTVANTSSLGFFVVSRISSTTIHISRNGTITSHSVTSAGIPNNNIYIGTINDQGSPGGSTGREYSFAFVGGSLTDAEIQTLGTRLETLLDYVGAGVI